MGLRHLEYDVPLSVIYRRNHASRPISLARGNDSAPSQLANDCSETAPTRCRAVAINWDLSFCNVTFEGRRAKVRFDQGCQIVLDLDSPMTSESEEVVGADQNHNYWAVYVDWGSGTGDGKLHKATAI
jgi:hypothetical protein